MRLVICGSLSAYATIMATQQVLQESGIDAVPPVAPKDMHFSKKQEAEMRRREAFAHIRRIRDPRTYGILVVNSTKRGINNYIGPSTFAEISVAFSQSKRIFIFYKYPDFFGDELKEWKAIELDGDVTKCISLMNQAISNCSLQYSLDI